MTSVRVVKYCTGITVGKLNIDEKPPKYKEMELGDFLRLQYTRGCAATVRILKAYFGCQTIIELKLTASSFPVGFRLIYPHCESSNTETVLILERWRRSMKIISFTLRQTDNVNQLFGKKSCTYRQTTRYGKASCVIHLLSSYHQNHIIMVLNWTNGR